MHKELYSVYKPRFQRGVSYVMVVSVAGQHDIYDDELEYLCCDLSTGKYCCFAGFELWPDALDESEYLTDITCNLDDKQFYLESMSFELLEDAASVLFHDYVKTDMTKNGWSFVQVLPHAYILKDTAGVETFVSCHIEEFNKERYSVFLKLEWDNLAPIGTVAKIGAEWKIFKLEQ